MAPIAITTAWSVNPAASAFDDAPIAFKMPSRPTRSIVSSAKNSATTIPATANVTPMIAPKTLFCSDTPGTSAIASAMVRTVTVGTAASICVASRSSVVPSSGVTSTAWNVPGATAASGRFAFSVRRQVAASTHRPFCRL